MISSYKSETSNRVVPNRSDVQKDSGHFSGSSETDKVFPLFANFGEEYWVVESYVPFRIGVIKRSKVSEPSPEPLPRSDIEKLLRIRERLEMIRTGRQVSIREKSDNRIQDCRRLIEDVISLVEKVVPHDTLQEILDEVYHDHIRMYMCMDD